MLVRAVLLSGVVISSPVGAVQASQLPPPSRELLLRHPVVAVARTRYDTLIKEQASHLSRVLRHAPGGTRLYVAGKERAFLKVLLGERIGYIAHTQVEILSGRKL